MGKIYIDDNLCKKCGGKCCKRSGCTFFPQDFERMSYNYLLEVLNKEYISISSEINFDVDQKGNLIWMPKLYLRIRNNNREIVDLVSYKSGCSILTENGCPLSEEKRPSMALSYKPMPNGECFQTIEYDKIIKAWDKYQDVLSVLVTHFTHKSVKEMIEYDIENLKRILTAKLATREFDDETVELLQMLELYNKSKYSPVISKTYKRGKKKKK